MTEVPEPAPSRGWLVIGAPMDGSGTGRGEVGAPRALRAAGLVERLGAVDFGDLPVTISDPRKDESVGVIGYRQLVNGTNVITDAVSSALHAGWRPLLVGGCCSILPGALAGARRYTGPAKLIFVDGHLDLFTPGDSRTGELAGMALAAVTGYGAAQLGAVAGDVPLVEPGDVLAIGDADRPRRRSFGGAEAATAIPDAHVLDARSIRSAGAAVIADRTAALIDRDGMPFWVHLDVDVLDGSLMPAVSYPVDGGVDWAELQVILGAFGHNSRLAGLSVAGLNVHRDNGLDSSRRLTALLAAVMS